MTHRGIRSALMASLLLVAAHGHAADLVPTHADLVGFKGYTHDGMPFRLYIPAGYQAGTPYRLVMFFHGAGGRGTDNAAQISGGNSNLSRLWAGASVQSQHPCFVLAPQCPSGQQWVNHNWGNRTPYVLANVPQSNAMGKAMAILSLVRAQWNIDPDRIYATGQSMGGYGTWDAVCRNPNLFAAAIPTAGGASPSSAGLIAHLPVWSHHIANDGTVPPDTDRLMYDALVAAGGKPTYTEYTTGGHNGWDQAASNPDTVRWMFSHVRGGPSGGNASTFMSFTPNGGSLSAGQTVALSSVQTGASIRYSLDGSAVSPTTGTPYSAPLAVSGTATLQAIAYTSAVFHKHAAPCTGSGGGGGSAPGTIAISPTTRTVAENAGMATLSVSRTGGSDGAVSVTWSTVGGSATADVDFTGGGAVLSWSHGDATARSISIPVVDDGAVESSEAFSVVLGAPTGGATLGAASSTVTILDDDVAGPSGSLAFDRAVYYRRESQGSVVCTVRRTGGATGAAGVAWTTAPGGATAPADFTAASGSLSWSDGDAAAKSFTVLLNDDAAAEAEERFTVRLSGPTGAILGVLSTAEVAIRASDTPPTLVQAATAAPSTIARGDQSALSASASDIVGEGLTWLWTVVSGPAGGLDLGAADRPSITAIGTVAGSYLVRVTASDADGQSVSSEAMLTVVEADAAAVFVPATPDDDGAPCGTGTGLAALLLALCAGLRGHRCVKGTDPRP